MKNGIMTRAIVDESHASTSNPDLLTNWENLESVVLNKVNADGTVDRATLPWRNGAQTLLPPTFRYDIKKRDGWKMVCHTFAGRGFDEGNYMVFYNQLTGYFKVFYYFEGDNNLSGAQWYMETLEDQKAKMFEMTEYLSKTLKDAGKNDILLLSNAIKSPVGSFSRGWNGF